MPRRIGLDVHREFAQIAVWEDGLVRQAGQIGTTPEDIRAFAESLLPSDEWMQAHDGGRPTAC